MCYAFEIVRFFKDERTIYVVESLYVHILKLNVHSIGFFMCTELFAESVVTLYTNLVDIISITFELGQ